MAPSKTEILADPGSQWHAINGSMVQSSPSRHAVVPGAIIRQGDAQKAA